MKLCKMNRLWLLLIILYSLISMSVAQYDFEDSDLQEEDINVRPDAPDKELEKIRENIYEIAKNMMSKSSIKKKRIEIGDLPDGYPIEMKEKAKLVRQNKDNWDPFLLYPTSIWRMCIYPNFKINYVMWCKQKFALAKSKIKLNGKVKINK